MDASKFTLYAKVYRATLSPREELHGGTKFRRGSVASPHAFLPNK